MCPYTIAQYVSSSLTQNQHKLAIFCGVCTTLDEIIIVYQVLLVLKAPLYLFNNITDVIC